MQKNNKGFSLVELIVSMALLVVVALMLGYFMNSATKIYVNTNSDVNAQYKIDTVAAQICDLVSECDAITLHGGAEKDVGLYMKSTGTVYRIRCSHLGGVTGSMLMYDEYTFDTLKTGGADLKQVLYRDAISLSCKPNITEEGKTIDYVTVTVCILAGGKNVTSKRIVHCKNSPVFYNDLTNMKTAFTQ